MKNKRKIIAAIQSIGKKKGDKIDIAIKSIGKQR
jgi:hypothetical protein